MPITTNPNPVISQRLDKLIREYERVRGLAATAKPDAYAKARRDVEIASIVLAGAIREHGAPYRLDGWIYSVEARGGELWRQRDGNAK